MGDQYIKTMYWHSTHVQGILLSKKKKDGPLFSITPSHILYPIVDGFVHLHRLHFQLNITSKNQTKGNHGTCVTNVAFGV